MRGSDVGTHRDDVGSVAGDAEVPDGGVADDGRSEDGGVGSIDGGAFDFVERLDVSRASGAQGWVGVTDNEGSGV